MMQRREPMQLDLERIKKLIDERESAKYTHTLIENRLLRELVNELETMRWWRLRHDQTTAKKKQDAMRARTAQLARRRGEANG